MSQDAFLLEPVPPFRLDLTAWALRRRPDNAVDRWDGRRYHRALALETCPVKVTVTQAGALERPRLEVTVEGERAGAGMRRGVIAALERLLGLRIDLTEFEERASRDDCLGPLARRFRGMKPPRFPTVFECLVNAIVCQQVTLTLGVRLLNRLAEAYGRVVDDGGAPVSAFPRPEDLAGRQPDELRALGLSRQKARALIEVAGASAAGRMDLEALASETDEVAVERLGRLRGVGRWTAEYVLLRGLGRLHCFPGDDVGARNNLRAWLNLSAPLDYESVRQVLTPWQGHAGLIYFHLLLGRLAETGAIAAGAMEPLRG
jgi:DNA-3-methyladenine glycosylase II